MLNQNTIVVCIKRHSADNGGYCYTTSNTKEVIEKHCRELLLMNTNYSTPMLMDEEIGNQLVLFPNYMPTSQASSVDINVYLNALY